MHQLDYLQLQDKLRKEIHLDYTVEAKKLPLIQGQAFLQILFL
jgi:hypothetical protein